MLFSPSKDKFLPPISSSGQQFLASISSDVITVYFEEEKEIVCRREKAKLDDMWIR